jgi:hypothetical protein
MCRKNGWVNVGPVDQSLWFSDGYGDYIRHFLAGMGSVPEWAPDGQSHLLKTTSVITDVKYGMKDVSYAAFDADGAEVLKLNFTPQSVLADGKPLKATTEVDQPGWTFDSSSNVLRIRRSGAKTILVSGSL